MTFDLKSAREALSRATERANVAIDIHHLAALTYLPAALDEIVRLRRECRECINANTYAQAKRIAELEEALVEERTWHFVIGGADECIVPDEKFPENGDCYCVDAPMKCPANAYLREVAREQLRREGKI